MSTTIGAFYLHGILTKNFESSFSLYKISGIIEKIREEKGSFILGKDNILMKPHIKREFFEYCYAKEIGKKDTRKKHKQIIQELWEYYEKEELKSSIESLANRYDSFIN